MNSKHSSEYVAFSNAKQRCMNPKNPKWADYGARGIQFRFKRIRDGVAHIGPKPSNDYYLDRIDPEGHYEVGNVRWVIPSVSTLNCRKRKDNTSGFRGVSPTRSRRKWQAFISTSNKANYLGTFSCAEEAARAYDNAARQLYGKYAILNFPVP